MSEDYQTVEDLDYFEPVSELAGNIEIVYNLKEQKIDPYEPVEEQTILTIGKSGRANRLTFDEVTTESLDKMIEALQKIKEQKESIKEAEQPDEDADMVTLTDLNEHQRQNYQDIKTILDELDAESAVELEKVYEESSEEGISREETSTVIEAIKREGEAFEPSEGYIQTI